MLSICSISLDMSELRNAAEKATFLSGSHSVLYLGQCDSSPEWSVSIGFLWLVHAGLVLVVIVRQMEPLCTA